MDLDEVEECLGEETVHTKAPRPETTRYHQKPPAVCSALSSIPVGGGRGTRVVGQGQRVRDSCVCMFPGRHNLCDFGKAHASLIGVCSSVF